jgi:hypothetical protein
MNERIKELIKQATTIEYGVDNGFDRVTFDKEKFAELIVRECAGVCEDYRGTEWGKAAECIGDSIKEHFGVEE